MSYLSAEHWHLSTYHLLHVQSPQPAAALRLSQVHLLEHSFTGRGSEHQLTQTNRWVLVTSYVALFLSTVSFCTKYCSIINSMPDMLHLIALYAQQTRNFVVWTNLAIITHIWLHVELWIGYHNYSISLGQWHPTAPRWINTPRETPSV